MLTPRKAPTIYPLLFAAIIGRALKGIGRFRAERGSQISVRSSAPPDAEGRLVADGEALDSLAIVQQ